MWVQPRFDNVTLRLVRPDGRETGAALRLPHRGSWLVASDGRGYALVMPADGGKTYDLRPGGSRRIPGSPVAVGPDRWLTVACRHHRCGYRLVNPATGARRHLPGRAAANPPQPPGPIAPDGSAAAVAEYHGGGRAVLHLINLASGADRRLSVRLGDWLGGPDTLAWSPDSRWLFVAAAHGRIAAVNPDTGRAGGLGIALPYVDQIAVTSPGWLTSQGPAG